MVRCWPVSGSQSPHRPVAAAAGQQAPAGDGDRAQPLTSLVAFQCGELLAGVGVPDPDRPVVAARWPAGFAGQRVTGHTPEPEPVMAFKSDALAPRLQTAHAPVGAG